MLPRTVVTAKGSPLSTWQELYQQGSPEPICILLQKARFLAILSARELGPAGLPHLSGRREAGSRWAAAARKAGRGEFPQCLHLLVQPWRHLLCLVRTRAPPRGRSGSCSEGIVHSCAADLRSQLPLTVLIFLSPSTFCKARKSPHMTMEKQLPAGTLPWPSVCMQRDVMWKRWLHPGSAP